jgi:hypothetical protein
MTCAGAVLGAWVVYFQGHVAAIFMVRLWFAEPNRGRDAGYPAPPARIRAGAH